MVYRFTLGALVLLIAGCAPLSIYYKPGVTLAKWQADTTACEVRAIRQVPVSNQIRQEPPVFVPPRQYCDANGNCESRGGYWVPGRVYTIDVNAGLRQRVETQCMARRGYTPVEIQRCPDGTAVSGPNSRLPPLTPQSCFVPTAGGGFVIVTRSAQ